MNAVKTRRHTVCVSGRSIKERGCWPLAIIAQKITSKISVRRSDAVRCWASQAKPVCFCGMSGLESCVTELHQECVTVKNLLYRNKNQHGSSAWFQYLKKVAYSYCKYFSCCNINRKISKLSMGIQSESVSELASLGPKLRRQSSG